VRSKLLFKIKNVIFTLLPRFALFPMLQFIQKSKLKIIFRSQSNESQIISNLLDFNFSNLPISFFEFGFDPTEFNCIELSQSKNSGFIVDMDPKKISLASKILNKKTEIINRKIEISDVKEFKVINKFQIVSIDIDGNDYEFAAEVLSTLKPSILICEYNAMFQDQRVKVPFSENFNRNYHHRNYYGCSLKSLLDLAHSFNYCLAGVSNSAVNAFFVPSRNLSINICSNNLKYGLNQNYIGAVSKNGTLDLNKMFLEIKHLPLENLEFLASTCVAIEGN
jgi:hypothetical protein